MTTSQPDQHGLRVARAAVYGPISSRFFCRVLRAVPGARPMALTRGRPCDGRLSLICPSSGGVERLLGWNRHWSASSHGQDYATLFRFVAQHLLQEMPRERLHESGA